MLNNEQNIINDYKNGIANNSNCLPHNSDSNGNICNATHNCHRPLRLWSIKYTVIGFSKFTGVAIIQAATLKEAECVFKQNSKFNGFIDRIKINCIEEILPNPEPLLLQEDTVAILDKSVLKSYPFLLKTEICKLFEDLNYEVAQVKGELVSPIVEIVEKEHGYDLIVTDSNGEHPAIHLKNGDSAYEEWLNNGNEGSFEDFYNSLKGEKGDKGDQGDQGEKGDKGDNGITPHIGPNGNWFIGDIDTGIASTINVVNDNTVSQETTWSSYKIKNALNSIEFGSYKIVDELPTEDISTSIIYLIDREGEENVKDAYVYSDGEWLLVGNTHIDLSGYYTSQEVDERIANSQQGLKSGTAITVNNNKINLKYDPEYLTIDNQGRLTLRYKIKFWDEMDSGEEYGGGGEESGDGQQHILSGDYLKQVSDLDSYEGTDGEIVQYTGPNTDKYTNGYTYQYRLSQDSVVIPTGTKFITVRNNEFIQPGTYVYNETAQFNEPVFSLKQARSILNSENIYFTTYSYNHIEIGDKSFWDKNGNLYKVTDKADSSSRIRLENNDIIRIEKEVNLSTESDKYTSDSGNIIYLLKSSIDKTSPSYEYNIEHGFSDLYEMADNTTWIGSIKNYPQGPSFITYNTKLTTPGISEGTFDTTITNAIYDIVPKDIQSRAYNEDNWEIIN